MLTPSVSRCSLPSVSRAVGNGLSPTELLSTPPSLTTPTASSRFLSVLLHKEFQVTVVSCPLSHL